MASNTITVIGSLNTDLVTTTSRVPSGGETLTASSFATGLGGKGANQAVAAARLSPPSVSVRMIGAVGGDEFGPPLINGLKKDGIDISGVRVVESKTTGVAVILVEENSGENRILLNPGANHAVLAEEFETVESFGAPRPDLLVLQLEIPLQTVLKILETAKREGVNVLLNPAPAVALPDEAFAAITHLILNESEAAILSGRKVQEVEEMGTELGAITDHFHTMGVKSVVVTLGAKGAYYSEGQGRGKHVEADKVKKVVDTTAAGDTFVGAYAVKLVDGKGMEESVRWACRAAGKTVEKEGAQSAIPWLKEVDV
jgi:ribokinase